MRLLPDKPSIGFLRKEAKDVLAALRTAYDPKATLADAHQALAAQYGVRDWTALRAEVERRAADRPVVPAGLAEEIAGAFGLGELTAPPAPVAFTPMGRSWSITTGRGRLLAGPVYPWITNDQAEIGERLRTAAVEAGIAAPTPVRSPRGQLIEPIRDQNWRVHAWLEVGPSPVAPTTREVAGQVGGIFGTLHTLGVRSETPIGPYLTERWPESAWHALVDEARAAGKPWAEQLAGVLPTLFELATIRLELDPSDGSDRPSLLLCNRNLIPESVRAGHRDRLVVVEWDLAGSLTAELELGSALTHWLLSHWARWPRVDPVAVRAFRDGYAGTAGEWPELTPGSFAVAITGYLNWIYQTVCASMNARDPDEVAFADRESADQLARPMTRGTLDDLIAATLGQDGRSDRTAGTLG